MEFNSDNVNLGMQIGSKIGREYLAKSNEWFSLSFLKPYFMVDNYYVLRKLKFVFLPYFFKDVDLEEDKLDSDTGNTTNNVQYDLYLPIVGFITYLLLLAINIGIVDNTEFNPDLIWFKATKNFSIVSFHVVVLKIRKFYY